MAAKTPKVIRPFHVIISQEGEWVSARVLEYNFAVQARTIEAIQGELERVIRGHIAARLANGQEPFTGLLRAPHKIWAMLDESKLALPRHTFPLNIKPPSRVTIRDPEVRVVATSR